MGRRYRFGFIFLDEIHHINHFVTVAVALSKNHEVSILTYPASHSYLRDKLTALNGGNICIKELKTHPFRQLTDYIKNRKTPRKGFWMKYNKSHLLKNYDALIFTDYIHHKLQKYRGLELFPKFIKFPHGPAGRSYAYKKDLLDFDLHIVFGTHYYDQLKASNLLGNQTEVAGYFKSDAIKGQNLPRLFGSEKPVVLYNPHFDPDHTSWHALGVDVLAYFKHQDIYNLIYAPHINLFNKVGVQSDASILDPYRDLPHIHIDLGSTASVDMTYLEIADIYLGDASSQAIEFITKPRPCIFINAQDANYVGNHNYYFWKNGQVITSITQLDNALKSSQSDFSQYKNVQRRATEKDFEVRKESTATERGVCHILNFMDTQKL